MLLRSTGDSSLVAATRSKKTIPSLQGQGRQALAGKITPITARTLRTS